jgi:hypothetical protein
LLTVEDWESRPKPAVAAPPPVDADNKQLVGRTRLMYDMIRLALETDSTRLVTLFVYTAGVFTDLPGVKHEVHSLTHHGNRPEMVRFASGTGTMRGLEPA